MTPPKRHEENPLQRRDFVMLSSTLRQAREKLKSVAMAKGDSHHAAVVEIGIDYAAKMIGLAIKEENRAFDLGRFLADSGVVDGPTPLGEVPTLSPQTDRLG
jgi:hypothetical protein